MNLSKEDVSAIFFIISICLNIFQLVDQNYFAKERIFNSFVKKTNKNKKCIICDRPMIITGDDDTYD